MVNSFSSLRGWRRRGRRTVQVQIVLLLAVVTAATARAESESGENKDPRRVALEETQRPGATSQQHRGLIARRDRKRLRRPLTVPILGRELVVSGRITLDNELEIDRLRDFDLEDKPKDRARGRRPLDDQLNLDQRLELDFFYTFNDRIAVYFANQISFDNRVYADFEQKRERWAVERKEAWLYFGDLFDTPLGVQLGAQRFSDDREWWWDEDLDALRLRFDLPTVQAEISVAEQLFPRDFSDDQVDEEEDDILRILGQIEWQWAKKQTLAIRFLHQDDQSSGHPVGRCARPPLPNVILPPFFLVGCIDPDREDESDARLSWIGGSAEGRVDLPELGRVHYWLDLAGVFGKETFYDFAGPDPFSLRRAASRSRHSVEGVGLDLGLIWQADLFLKPTLVLGYAYGSGQHGESATRQRGFRQTGLHDNSDKFRGVATFNYYGELFDPELANLEIWTFGAGVRFLHASSLDVVYHIYRQDVASEFLRDVGFKRDPFGRNKEIGEEIDVILGIEEWERFEIKTVFAMFNAGKAFGPGENQTSFLGKIRFRMNF